MAAAKHPMQSNVIIIDEDTTLGGYRLRIMNNPSITGSATGTTPATFLTKSALHDKLQDVFRFTED